MKLYGFPISPNSKRVQVCAAELGLPLDVQNLDFAAGEQRAPAYLALNPMGKVPTVTDGDFALWESAAILCHLGASRPGALWPVEPRAQAHVLQWLFFTSCHLDPYFTTLVVERLIKARRGAPADEARVASALEQLGRFLAILEGQLTGRDYLTGTFTVADIAAGCTVELASLVLVDLAPYPHTRAWLARLGARASWRSAAPAIAA
jgi:glutathione S-transferase